MLRIRSIDILRGAVMVLMAIDHVRVYSGVPAGGTAPGVFFTRWVTHFCAPAFAFFAGTGVFLYARKRNNAAAYLITRGLLLVIFELTILRFSWTFNFDYKKFTLAGVLWMLGWCMVLMAPLVRLPAAAVGVIGLAIVVFQQAFRLPARWLPASARWIWEFVYPSGDKAETPIAILYVIVPWIGVMAAGYGFGLLLHRRRLCYAIGLGGTALFLILAAVNVFSTPGQAPAYMRILNQQKYPASVLFLLMTLGPAIALIPVVENARGWFADALALFGRVPMFYYLLHIPLIHSLAVLVDYLREGQVHPEWYATAPYAFVPPPHRWPLPLLYVVWAIAVAILYGACRWFADVKARRPGGWLRYI